MSKKEARAVQRIAMMLLGLPVRTDATLDPGELWIEQADGTTVRVWPPPKEDADG